MILSDPGSLLSRIPALLLAITFHEYAHARMAYAWGDPTAKYAGRMTLNPLSHLDPLGVLMLLIVRFGWAKPVPINMANFRDRNRGLFWVSLAGPGMNLLIGLIATFLLFIFAGRGNILYSLIYNIMIYNVFLAVFNIIPLPPLDGSKILVSLLPPVHRRYYASLEPYGPFILIMLLVLGLLPILLIPLATVIINIFQIIARFLFV